MPTQGLAHYLRDHHVKFETIPHAPAYTAQEIAAAAHVSGMSLAKTVMVKVDGKMMMVIEPANYKVDLKVLKKLLNANDVQLAHEYEFENMFPDCETGAMSPFGELSEQNVDVFIDEVFWKQDNISFNAGNHEEIIQMRLNDFETLAKPTRIRLHDTE